MKPNQTKSKLYTLSPRCTSGQRLDTLYTLLFYFSILFFIIGFNFSDTPPPTGWYQQFMPDLGGRQITDITFLDSLTGYAITSQVSGISYLLKTTNRGDNWSVIYSDTDSNHFTVVKFVNQNTGFIGGLVRTNFSYHILKTSNGGNNWFNISTPAFTYQADMSVLNEDTIYYTMDESTTGGVFRTTNGGVSWEHQVNLGGSNPDRIYMYNAGIGFISRTSSQQLRKTTDGGLTWNLITGTGTGSFNDLYFADSLTGWKAKSVGGGGWLMGKTSDGGYNWVEQILPSGGNISTGSGIIRFKNVNRDTIWGVGGGLFYPGQGARAFLYRTTNQGDTWYFQVPDTSYGIVNLSFIDFVNRLTGWAYRVAPTGIHTVTGGNDTFYTSVKNISSSSPDEFALFQNYPNPFNPSTNIRFQIASNVKRETSNVKLIVYNIQGRIVSVIADREFKAGTYEVTFDGTNYSSGIYFYSLIVDEKSVDTKKMILIK